MKERIFGGGSESGMVSGAMKVSGLEKPEKGPDDRLMEAIMKLRDITPRTFEDAMRGFAKESPERDSHIENLEFLVGFFDQFSKDLRTWLEKNKK